MQKLHIILKKDQRIWFTSDLHFGHRNVIRFCDRPYEDEKDMGRSLIFNWNSVVGENDIVFVLGDTFWFNDSKSIKKVTNELNGEIYVLPGNHDEFEHWDKVDASKVHLCQDVCVMWLDSEDNRWGKKLYEIWMSHYPMMTWPHRENGAMQLFGHIHSKEGRTGVDQDLPLYNNQLDVGCDYWNYYPVSFEEVLKKIEG